MALLQSVHTRCSPHSAVKNGTFTWNARVSAIHVLREPFCLHPRRQSLNSFSRLRISNYVPGSKLERGVSASAPEQNATASKPKRGRPRKKKPENEHTDKATQASNTTQADSNGSVPVKKLGRKKKENLPLEEFLSKSLDNLLSEKDGEDSPSNSAQTENARSYPEGATEQTQRETDYGINVEDQPDFVDEEDYDWPEEADAVVEDRWKVRASDYFAEPLIRNVRDDDGNVIDWEGEADNYSIKEICSMEWEPLVFHPSPLIVLVFERYRRASDNWKALKELEKAIQVYWDSKNKLPPRTVKLDAKVEKDLASALKIEETPELLFIRGSKLLYRETEIRTADELVKMIAHFYYNAKRPSWLKMTALDTA